MILDLVLAFGLPSMDNLGEFAMQALAVVGGAFGGGYLVGLLTQLLARGLTTRSVPPSALRFVRILGGIVCGVLVAMVMFGSRGGDWPFGGGGGGPVPGKRNGDTSVEKDRNAKDQVVQDKPPPKDAELPPKKTALKVEVIRDSPQAGRFYRVEGEDKMKSLPEVGDLLSQRRKQNLERVDIVLYQNSPDKDTVVVRELVDLIKLHNLTPSISIEPGQAP